MGVAGWLALSSLDDGVRLLVLCEEHQVSSTGHLLQTRLIKRKAFHKKIIMHNKVPEYRNWEKSNPFKVLVYSHCITQG